MIKHPFENEQRNGHVVERMVLDQANLPRIPPGCASPLLDVQTVACFPCMPRSRKGKLKDYIVGGPPPRMSAVLFLEPSIFLAFWGHTINIVTSA